MKNIIVISLCALILTSCKDDTAVQNTGDGNIVSGIILSKGVPVAQASVSLNKQIGFTAETDSNGKFSIYNVPKGNYSLRVYKTNSDGTSQERTSELSVTENVFLQSLLLPRPIHLSAPEEVTGSSMSIHWNSTDANDFREYKLYRKNNSGLDETTGELIHVSTSITDTGFVDTGLSPLTKYYYRVYVMNEFGKLGGSNIISSTTGNVNYIPNGGFEDTTGFPKWWSFGYVPWGTVSISRDTSKEGKNSVALISAPFSEYGVSGKRARLFSGFTKLAEGDYKLSYWVKVRGIPATVSTYNWYHFVGSDNIVVGVANDNLFPAGVKKEAIIENEWVYVEKQIKILDYYYKNYGFYFEVRSYCDEAWFDEIKLEKVE